MSVIIGDETGLLKIVNITSEESVKIGSQTRKNEIKGLTWLEGNSIFACCRVNGELSLWHLNEEMKFPSMDNLFTVRTNCMSPIAVRSYNSRLLTIDEKGTISIDSFDEDDLISKSISRNNHVTEWNNFGPLSSCDISFPSKVIALGGKENDTKIYDIETKEEVWRAKNVPHDNLNLRIPIWVTALSFQRSTEDHGKCFFTGTGYKHLRFYDTRTSKQPIISIPSSEDFRVTAIETTMKNPMWVYAADTAGNLDLWDMRNTSKKISTLKGGTGSIRNVKIDQNEDLLFSVGLDRHLRIFDVETSKISNSIYLKNRLNCCILVENKRKNLKKRKRQENVSKMGNKDYEGEEDIVEELSDSEEDSDDESGKLSDDDDNDDDDDAVEENGLENSEIDDAENDIDDDDDDIEGSSDESLSD